MYITISSKKSLKTSGTSYFRFGTIGDVVFVD